MCGDSYLPSLTYFALLLTNPRFLSPSLTNPHARTLDRDIPVETVVARYSGRLYSMPEFEDALYAETTTGDYAFQAPCNPMWWSLQPCVVEPATLCGGGCNPL